MKFAFVTLYISRLDESLRLYRDVLGMQEQRRMNIENGGVIVFLGEEGTVQLELIANPTQENPNYSGFSLGFDVDNLEAATQKLEAAKIRRLRGPFPAGEAFMSFFEGPNGETVELVGP